MNEKDIEQEIQTKGLTAPRVTHERIEGIIVAEHYFSAAEGIGGACDGYKLLNPANGNLHLLTFCVLVLENGFTVTGESACASPENFEPEIGRKIARQNAMNKIWQLEGYLLKQKLHEQKEIAGMTWFDRLLDESNTLNTRIHRLNDYIQSNQHFASLSEDQQNQLREQLTAMKAYQEIVDARIEANRSSEQHS